MRTAAKMPFLFFMLIAPGPDGRHQTNRCAAMLAESLRRCNAVRYIWRVGFRLDTFAGWLNSSEERLSGGWPKPKGLFMKSRVFAASLVCVAGLLFFGCSKSKGTANGSASAGDQEAIKAAIRQHLSADRGINMS